MINSFLQYLQYEKNYSSYTVLSYRDDIKAFGEFLQQNAPQTDIAQADTDQIRQWLMQQNITARDERQWPAGCPVASGRETGSSAGLEQFAQVVNHQRRLLQANIFAMVVAIGQRHTGHSGGAGGQHVIARVADKQARLRGYASLLHHMQQRSRIGFLLRQGIAADNPAKIA